MSTSERKYFEEALKQDKYDEITHRVFADYLEEHGFDTEAEFHRKWTREWQEAYDWMDDFAVNTVTENDWEGYDYGYPDPHPGRVTVEDLLRVGREYIATGNTSCLSGLGFGATNAWDKEIAEQYWKCYQVLEGVVLEEEYGEGQMPFGCCI